MIDQDKMNISPGRQRDRSKVKFEIKHTPKSTPRRGYNKRDRRGQRTEERRDRERDYDHKPREKIIRTLPSDKSGSKKKKGGLFNGFMEMLGFGCCSTRA